MATVREILQRDKAAGDSETPIGVAMRELNAVQALLEELVAAVRPETDDEDWELIYDSVFGEDEGTIGVRVREALDNASVNFFDYADPDTSYEEDVRAWMRAFEETRGHLSAMWHRETDGVDPWQKPRDRT